MRLILASASEIRSELLSRVGLSHDVVPARIDEEAVRAGLEAEEAPPRDVADTLAELKARKISEKNPEARVLGCDQILAFDRRIFAKPETEAEAIAQLADLSGQTHSLISAAVLCEAGQPVWRHVGVARLTMRALSEDFMRSYVTRNWPDLATTVGAYKIEAEGLRLFARIEGDHFTIQGLPMLPLISHFITIGALET